MDEESQGYFNSLRERHFPPERNYLAAHLTLFHALPGLEIENVRLQVGNVARQYPVICGKATGVRSLGRGVAITIDCGELVVARAALARSWHVFLTPQDRQGWRPHVTIQNKVSPAVALGLLQELSSAYVQKSIQFVGLDLWHYNGGPWELAESYTYSGSNS